MSDRSVGTGKTYTATVITVSDRSASGERKDASGPALRESLTRHGFSVGSITIVPDEQEQISTAIRNACRASQLVVTTGGTGLSARDVTPEATRAVCERLIEGIPELIRAAGMKQTPMAALSRGLCGTVGSSIVINVPGSPSGAVHSFEAVAHLIPHALELLAGNTAHAEPA